MDLCRRAPFTVPPLAAAPTDPRTVGHGPEDVDDPFAPGAVPSVRRPGSAR
ncbi:hypothetical protein ACFXEL_20425 [Streptomyces sp. NPDC059382]|uniref:hypothetical protein n=1 Tax=unclassified Streptomyces TaxID=2593676 RepID=UPI00331D8FBE